jgi:hypothetical protein
VGENRGRHGAADRFGAQGGEDLSRAAVPADDRGAPAVPGAGRPYRLQDRGPQPRVEVIDRALDDGHVTLAQVPLGAGGADDHPGDVGPVRGVPAAAASAHRAHRHGREAARCGRRRQQRGAGRGGALTGQVAAGQVQAGRGGDPEDGGSRHREAAVLAGDGSASGGQGRAADHRIGPQQSEIVKRRRRSHHVGHRVERADLVEVHVFGRLAVHRALRLGQQPEDPGREVLPGRAEVTGADVPEHVGQVPGAIGGRRRRDHGAEAGEAAPAGGLGPQPETGHAE